MADGLNEPRAMRIAEIITDYQAIQQRMASYSQTLASSDPNLPATVVLRQCLHQCQALLEKPLPHYSNPPSPGEETKRNLQALILDAASRRFAAWRLHQRAMAAIKALQRRAQLLQGRSPTSADRNNLSTIDNALRTDIIAVTDARVQQELQSRDTAAGHWVGEMPNLLRIQQYLQQHL